MDQIDKKILCELDLNCRTPVTKIAKKLRINRNVADYRIKNLQNEGIISNYITAINLGKLGYKTYKIYFKIRREPNLEKEFISYLKEAKEIIQLVKTEGSADYSISIATKNILELDKFLMYVKSNFRNLIKDYFVSIVVYSRIFKLDKLLLDNKQNVLKSYKYSGDGQEIPLDDIDIKILKSISQNANISIVDVANKTKLSLDIVKYRLKKLESELITNYRIIPDLNKLGYFHYAIMLQIKQAKEADENKLVSWCSLNKKVLYCTKRIGYFDFIINVAIKDINDLNNFLSELKLEFDYIIDSYDTMLYSQILKLNYIPF